MSILQQESLEDVHRIANERGLIAFTPMPDELFIDGDSPYFQMNAEIYSTLLYVHEVLTTLTTRSPGGNKHLYIKLGKPIDDMERLLLQALLGSDPLKETLSHCQRLIGNTGYIALFETPEEAGRVMEWRGMVDESRKANIGKEAA